MGNLTTDVNYWGPPEAMTEARERRPVYAVNTAAGASDLAGSMAGALAAGSVVWRSLGADATYADGLLAGAKELYGQAKKYQGAYTAKFKCAAAARRLLLCSPMSCLQHSFAHSGRSALAAH